MKALRVRKLYKTSLIAMVHRLVRCIYSILKHQKGYIDPQIDYEVESAKKNARRWVKVLCELPEWKIDATDLSNGQKFKSANAQTAATA